MVIDLPRPRQRIIQHKIPEEPVVTDFGSASVNFELHLKSDGT